MGLMTVKYGTKAAYTAITTKSADALYFCTDTGELYKGDAAYSKAVKFVSSLPDGSTTAIAENVVYTLPSGELNVYNPAKSGGAGWEVVGVAKTTTVRAAASATDSVIPTELATRTAIDALLASPAFTGTPTAPTAASGTNTTQIATTAFVNDACDNVKASLAAAFEFKGVVADMAALEAIVNPAYGDVYQVTNAGTGKSNAEFVYVENAGSGSAGWVELGTVVDLSGYAPLASPVFTGIPTAPTPSTSDDSTQIATTAFVHDVADAAQAAAEAASDPAGSAAAAESAAKTYADGLVTWGTF